MAIPKPANPTWHGLSQGAMPSFPQEIVYGILDEFGITNPENIEPWPAGPFDILAEFQNENVSYVLKGRIVEQRGIESLFETQRIQKDLHQFGFPVSELFHSPKGETLIEGPNWKDDKQIFYEIQSVLPGGLFTPEKRLIGLSGELLGELHTLGERVRSQLMSKFYCIEHFTSMFPRNLQRFLQESRGLHRDETKEIHDIINRLSDDSLRSELTRGLTHGDFTQNNLLVHNGELALVDLDELGYGVAALDIVWGLKYVCQCDIDFGKAFIDGYRKTGIDFHDKDLQAIGDYWVAQSIRDFPFSELRHRINHLVLE
jgi:Ser/Thr protein kinase RdoA (MazF antagonist)